MDLEELLDYRHIRISDPGPKMVIVPCTVHTRVSYVIAAFTSPIQAGASLCRVLIEELDTLVFGHFSVVDSFWNIPWNCRECFVWSETPCLPILGASLANLAKGPTRRLRNRRRKKRYVGISFSRILCRIANIDWIQDSTATRKKRMDWPDS